MLSKESIQRINELALKYHLKLIILFGGLAEGIYNEASDMDIAILPENTKDFINNEEFCRLIHDFMDIEDIEKREADIVLITSENPILLYQIAKYGVPLYCENQDEYMNFLSWARFTYEDNKRFTEDINSVRDALNRL